MLLITCASRHWSDLHFNVLERIVPTSKCVPDYMGIFMGNGAMRCIHAVGVRHVALIVPEPSEVMLSAVVSPVVLVFVKGCELHVVVIRETVP